MADLNVLLESSPRNATCRRSAAPNWARGCLSSCPTAGGRAGAFFAATRHQSRPLRLAWAIMWRTSPDYASAGGGIRQEPTLRDNRITTAD